jgi:hypothetical protein
LKIIRLKLSRFKSCWDVNEQRKEDFIAATKTLKSNCTFDDVDAILTPIAERRVSASDRAEEWATFNYNIPEFGCSDPPRSPIVIEI